MKITKIIIGVAAIFGIIYLVKKAKKANGNAVPNTRPGYTTMQNPTPGPSQVRVQWTDITRRRCIDDQGRTYYQNAPCNK